MHHLRQLGLLASVSLFALSLSLPAVELESGPSASGLSFLVFGWMNGTAVEGPSISWWANPALFLSYIFIFGRMNRAAKASSGFAFALALTFLRHEEFVTEPMSTGATEAILGVATGYWVWVISIAVAIAVAALLARTWPPSRLPVTENRLSDELKTNPLVEDHLEQSGALGIADDLHAQFGSGGAPYRETKRPNYLRIEFSGLTDRRRRARIAIVLVVLGAIFHWVYPILAGGAVLVALALFLSTVSILQLRDRTTIIAEPQFIELRATSALGDRSVVVPRAGASFLVVEQRGGGPAPVYRLLLVADDNEAYEVQDFDDHMLPRRIATIINGQLLHS